MKNEGRGRKDFSSRSDLHLNISSKVSFCFVLLAFTQISIAELCRRASNWYILSLPSHPTIASLMMMTQTRAASFSTRKSLSPCKSHSFCIPNRKSLWRIRLKNNSPECSDVRSSSQRTLHLGLFTFNIFFLRFNTTWFVRGNVIQFCGLPPTNTSTSSSSRAQSAAKNLSNKYTQNSISSS